MVEIFFRGWQWDSSPPGCNRLMILERHLFPSCLVSSSTVRNCWQTSANRIEILSLLVAGSATRALLSLCNVSPRCCHAESSEAATTCFVLPGQFPNAGDHLSVFTKIARLCKSRSNLWFCVIKNMLFPWLLQFPPQSASSSLYGSQWDGKSSCVAT